MTTFERPPLRGLSTNSLRRAHTDLASLKPSLPKLKSVIPRTSFPSLTNSLSPNNCITKPSKPTAYATHARKLKYRLKLAYYKLQTDQIGVPLAEIIQKHEVTASSSSASRSSLSLNKNSTQLPPLQLKKPIITTPSLTRHMSLLAASTPLHSSGYAPILPKKTVTFKRSNSYVEPPTFSSAPSSSSTAATATNKPITTNNQRGNLQPHSQPQQLKINNKKSITLPRISEYPTFRIAEKRSHLTTSFPQLERASAPLAVHHIKIHDLMDSRATPMKSYRSENGDMLMSSPTKTPGSYGAAKSLLQLSALIGSN